MTLGQLSASEASRSPASRGLRDVRDDAELRDGLGDGPVVVDPALLGDVGVHRLVDHHHRRTGLGGVLGGGDGGRYVVADAHQDGGASRGLLDGQFGDEALLVGGERVELPGVAVRGDDADTAVEQPARQGAVVRDVDTAVLGERGHRDRHNVGEGRLQRREVHADRPFVGLLVVRFQQTVHAAPPPSSSSGKARRTNDAM
ncbi:hypothetical protein GA0115253_1016634 [Streptomyces sp. Termitarium-T10T-6]|nr:hypothetical protein GA0115253_1016634 [Streptomyces sp. Termitarium-T10T-6]